MVSRIACLCRRNHQGRGNSPREESRRTRTAEEIIVLAVNVTADLRAKKCQLKVLLVFSAIHSAIRVP